MKLFNFKPARARATREWQETKAVADFDRMVSCRVSFKLFGQEHYIEPVEMEVYLEFLAEAERLDAALLLAKSGSLEDKKLMYEQYGRIFHMICPTIEVSDVFKMTDPQIGGLVNLIHQCISGKAFVEDEKKKNPPSLSPPKLSDSE